MAKSSQRVLSMHEKIASMVNSSAFEYAAGFVILANLVVIGIEAQLSIDMVPMEFPPLSWPWWLERIFLLIYCALLRKPGVSTQQARCRHVISMSYHMEKNGAGPG